MLTYGVLILVALFGGLAVVRFVLAKRRTWSWISIGLGLAGLALLPKAPLIGGGLLALALYRVSAHRPVNPSREAALALLGLSEGASAEHIRAAHREKIRNAHPDRGGSPAHASALNAARDLLLGEGSVGNGR